MKQWITLVNDNEDECTFPYETEGTVANIGWGWIAVILIAWALAAGAVVWFLWLVM